MILLGTLTDACGATGQRGWICQAAYELTGSEDFAKVAETVSTPIRLILVLVVAAITAWVVRRLVARSLRHARDNDRISSFRIQGDIPQLSDLELQRREGRFSTLTVALQNIASVTIWVVAGFVFLDQLGYEIQSVLVAISAISVVIGIGAQQIIKDFFGGLFILMEDQFGVGDVIEAGNASGKVESISLRVTRLRDVEGVVWWIPNGTIAEVGNRSKEWSRALLDVEFDPTVDPGSAISVLEGVGAEIMADPEWSSRITADPEVWGVQKMNADSIQVRLVVKTIPLEQGAVARELRARIDVAARAAAVPLAGQPITGPVGEGNPISPNRASRPSAPEGEAGNR